MSFSMRTSSFVCIFSPLIWPKMAEDDAYAQQAKVLVDDVIEMAIKRLETNVSLMSEKERTFESFKFSEMSRDSTFVREDDYVIDNIAWLSIGEFSKETAQKKIEDFITVNPCLCFYEGTT